jgi:hypothetical protein
MCRFEDRAMKRAVIVTALLLFATIAHAQDARWTPWIGCWEPMSAASGTRVCVTRNGDNGVTLSTQVDGQPELQQTITADDADHPVSDAECRGTQRTAWSADGQRLFTNGTLTCGTAARTISGLGTIGPDGSWLDIQSVTIDGHQNTRVRRYRRRDVVAGTTRPATWLTLDAIKEASNKVSPEVVEAAIVETRSRFALNSRIVTGLADAHVPPALIDVMIGLSYPKKFVVERTSDGAPPLLSLDDDPYLLSWAFGSPIYGAAIPGLFYPAYYYSPFAYGYSGFYYPYAYGPTFTGVPVGTATPRPSGLGRVVDGLGYTRVRPRDAEAEAAAARGDGATASRGTASARTGSVSPQGYSAGSASAPASSAPSGGGSGGGASSGGGDSGGRTAVPR